MQMGVGRQWDYSLENGKVLLSFSFLSLLCGLFTLCFLSYCALITTSITRSLDANSNIKVIFVSEKNVVCLPSGPCQNISQAHKNVEKVTIDLVGLKDGYFLEDSL